MTTPTSPSAGVAGVLEVLRDTALAAEQAGAADVAAKRREAIRTVEAMAEALASRIGTVCTPASGGDLPPLPYPGIYAQFVGYYTADQMRAYGELCRLASTGSAPAPSAVPGHVAAVLAEVERATRKFPAWPTDPLHAVGVLNEEVGELNKALLQAVYEPHKSTPEDAATEAIQAAAMALRFVASLDRYDYLRCPQHEQPAAPTQEPKG